MPRLLLFSWRIRPVGNLLLCVWGYCPQAFYACWALGVAFHVLSMVCLRNRPCELSSGQEDCQFGVPLIRGKRDGICLVGITRSDGHYMYRSLGRILVTASSSEGSVSVSHHAWAEESQCCNSRGRGCGSGNKALASRFVSSLQLLEHACSSLLNKALCLHVCGGGAVIFSIRHQASLGL